MNKLIGYSKFLPLIVILSLLVMPIVVGAQVTAPGIDPPVNPVDGVPITGQGIANLIGNIANFLIAIGIVVAVIFIIVGGIMYMASAGDATKAATARGVVLNGLIGAAIVLGVGVLLSTAEYLVGVISSGDF